jgi:hypothetical protein
MFKALVIQRLFKLVDFVGVFDVADGVGVFKRGLWGEGPRFQTSPAWAFFRSQCGSRLR